VIEGKELIEMIEKSPETVVLARKDNWDGAGERPVDLQPS
jgi:hypothetical protein